jgi:hypothetical protein
MTGPDRDELNDVGYMGKATVCKQRYTSR